MNKNDTKSVIVIGGGLGGIAAAISCAAKGFSVSIFEKNNHIGGKLNVLQKDGFTFDLGPSILTIPDIFRQLCLQVGKNLDNYVTFLPLEVHWRNFFEDGASFDLYADRDKTAQHLESHVPGSAKQFRRFLHYAYQQYRVINRKYFQEGVDTFAGFMKQYNWLDILLHFDFGKTMHASVAHFFKERHLQDIFDYFAKYVGSSPYHAPGFMNCLPHVQYEYGLWYVKDGMYNLARGLRAVMEESGVKIRCNAEVKEIIKEGKRVVGVVLANNERHSADYIVSNMEVIPAYQALLKEPDSFIKRLEKFEPACSGLVLHCGLDCTYSQLAHHNFFYSKDQKKHFDTVFNRYQLPDDPTIYLVAPTRTDSSLAPKGGDNLKILPHIPYIQENNPLSHEDYIRFSDRVLEKLERMGLKNLREHIVVQDMWTPYDIKRNYYSNKGAIYGVVSDRKKNFSFKAPKKSTRYDNLYYVGGSVNPGAGMPMVTLSGIQTARLIEQDSKK